jgi:hypothetical protein
MTDWNRTGLNNLSFTLCGDEIREHGDAVFIPVVVADAEGVVVLRHNVALKLDFYRDLRSLDDWREQLHAICRERVLQTVRELQSQARIPVRDKMELFHAPARKLLE